jgi:hypothetical protein
MARRKTVNQTGIARLSNIPTHDAWVTYVCVNCRKINHVHIGKALLSPDEAMENCAWVCSHCGFIHAKESDLPIPEFLNAEPIRVLRFWKGFFRIATENPEAYWKQCKVCGRILPFSAFDKHRGWGALERQMECKSCKGAINAALNPRRTKQQLHESSVRRRIGDLFVKSENQKFEDYDFEDLFRRFNSKCFKTGKELDINQRDTWQVDHILPSVYLYPLNKTNAALLSKDANNSKRAKWPSEVYTNSQLIELARITGANLELISSSKPIINQNIDVNEGVEKYLKVRENSNLLKRIMELKKILEDYQLIDKLSDENKQRLGF